MISWLLLIACLDAPPQSAAPPADAEFDALVRQARTILETSGPPQRAVELLQCAVARRPEQLDAALLLADAHVAAGRPDEARTLLRNLRGRFPRSTQTRKALAQLEARAGRWTDVRELLEKYEPVLTPPELLLLERAYRETGAAARGRELLQRGVERFPDAAALWLMLVDLDLSDGQPATALQRVRKAQQALGDLPLLRFRLAQVYFQLNQPLGRADVRTVAGGRVGQFAGAWLLVEQRDGSDRFLCCPEESALYQLRRALDAGLDDPRAVLLHAEIWRAAGRVRTAHAVLTAQQQRLIEARDADLLARAARVALEAGELASYLEFSQARAQVDAPRGPAILRAAYLEVAEQYNLRGDAAGHAGFLRRALELQPEDPGLLLRVADAEWEIGRRREAARLYERVLQLDHTAGMRPEVIERLGEMAASRPPSAEP